MENLVPNSLELAYLGIEVPDPASLTSFWSETIGLSRGEDLADGVMTWRNDDKSYRIVVRPGPTEDAVFLGLEGSSDVVFDETVDRLARAGFEVTGSSSKDLRERRVARMAETVTPWGVRLELVQKLPSSPVPFTSELVPDGFVTSGVGFGHAVFATTAFEESHAFLTAGLGFAQSDWIETEIADGIELEVRFYHCNRRHHTIALARTPFELPKRLHHLMIETRSLDDTGAAFDRAWASGLPIPNGLGRHDNDRIVSFYVASPAGFLVEVGHGARTISAGWADNRRYDRISIWGHQALRA